MSYQSASIAALSPSQISKALKGLPIRVSVGDHHPVELSQEQFKKLSKAGLKGKAATIAMDPFQIQNHMHLLGAGQLKKNIRHNASRLITSGTDRAIRAIEGSGALKKNIRHNASRLITSGTDRAIRAIEGSGFRFSRGQAKDMMKLDKKYGHYMPSMGSSEVNTDFLDDPLQIGLGVNHLKKGQRWEHFANATIRDGIDTAGKAARVYNKSKNPMSMLGFGVRKRGRPRKHGGALFAA